MDVEIGVITISTFAQFSLGGLRFETQTVDRENGEWFWQVSEDRQPAYNIAKVSPWKCPYHYSRACFEIMERLEAITH
jgi:mannose/cellobiose epimerase-like protein (N-acyl-D-glucosamine 2-epimerase family)